jgi:hypothetical protein
MMQQQIGIRRYDKGNRTSDFPLRRWAFLIASEPAPPEVWVTVGVVWCGWWTVDG